MIGEPAQARSVFFALQPDDSVAMQLMQAASRARDTGLFRGGRPSRTYHMTLHFLGAFAELPAQLVRDATAAAESIRFAPFEFALDRIETFAATKPPCVLRSDEATDSRLREFHFTLTAALKEVGLGGHPARAHFAPHVTLAYAHARVAQPLALESIIWPVREFVLLESLVGRTTHNRLGAWPLIS